MHELMLEGCRAEPLASYLKSIGLLRLVGEQVDPETRGHWVGDTFCLTTSLTMDNLVSFLVDRYVPTPVITPWNNGSGFGPADEKSSPKSFAAVQSLAESSNSRLRPMGYAIRTAREYGPRLGWMQKKVNNKLQWVIPDKARAVALLRNGLPDDAVRWLDAAVVLTSNDIKYPPLLGSGGNDGRFDLGGNFAQRIDALITERTEGVRSSGSLAFASLSDTGCRLEFATAGMFDPSAAGGPGSAADGGAESLSNPWDFVLQIEGAVGFAAATVRRLSSDTEGSATPFMVRGVSAGYASASEEGQSTFEFWAPLWRQPATGCSVVRLLSEGRVEFSGRQARNALDVARALGTLGVDRGVDEFVRYALLVRNGQTRFAVPCGRFTASKPVGPSVLAQIDAWLNRVRTTKNLPASASSLLRQIDGRQFSDSQKSDPSTLQALLIDVHKLERLAARSANIRKETRTWVVGPRARDWIDLLDDGTVEFELAVAFASLRSVGDQWGRLRSVLSDKSWSGRPSPVVGLGTRPLEDLLADCLVRVSSEMDTNSDGVDRGYLGASSARCASGAALAAFSVGQCADERISDLLGALLLLDWREVPDSPAVSGCAVSLARLPVSLAILKPLFHHRGLADWLATGRPLRAAPDVPRLLASLRARRALESAMRSLRIAGCDLVVGDCGSVSPTLSAKRAAAACLIPVADTTIFQLLNRIADEPGAHTKEQES